MTDRPVRVGIVGLGFGARILVPVFRSLPGVTVTALAGTDAAKARSVAEPLGIPHAFGEWHKLVASPEVDAVAIAVPPAAQEPIALGALAAKRPVFCEKPLATGEAAAETLAHAASRSGLANMIDFEFAESPVWQRAKAELEAGAIGKVRHVQVTWAIETVAVREGERSWKTDLGAGGGTLSQFTCHSFAYLEWLLGPITTVAARLFALPGDGRTGDTLATLAMTCASGAVVAYTASSHAVHGRGHWLEFHGSEGAMVLENSTADYLSGFRLLAGKRGGKLEVVLSDPPRGPGMPDGRIAAVGAIASRFVAWVRGGPAAHPDLQDGLRVQRLLGAARRSHDAGGAVQTVLARG